MMDNFTIGLIFWVFTAVISFFIGQYTPNQMIVGDCADKGEHVIQGTVLECKPIATFINGKRVSINEPIE